jgi:hypothetical protein
VALRTLDQAEARRESVLPGYSVIEHSLSGLAAMPSPRK